MSTSLSTSSYITLEELLEAYPDLEGFMEQLKPWLAEDGCIVRGTGESRDQYFQLLKENKKQKAEAYLLLMRTIFGPNFTFLSQEEEASDGFAGMLLDEHLQVKLEHTFGSTDEIPSTIAFAQVGGSSTQYDVVSYDKVEGKWAVYLDRQVGACLSLGTGGNPTSLCDTLLAHHLHVERIVDKMIPLVIVSSPGYACINDRYCARSLDDLDHSLEGNPKTGGAYAFASTIFQGELAGRLYLPNRNKGAYTVSFDTSPAVMPLQWGAILSIDVGSKQTQVWCLDQHTEKFEFIQKSFLKSVERIIFRVYEILALDRIIHLTDNIQKSFSLRHFALPGGTK